MLKIPLMIILDAVHSYLYENNEIERLIGEQIMDVVQAKD
jgi:hypothetical protein